MADAPSTSSSVKRKRKRTNDGYCMINCGYCEVPHVKNSHSVINWGLNRDVATRTEHRYKKKPSQVKSLPLPIQIESYPAGNSPSVVTHMDRYTTHGHVVYFYCHFGGGHWGNVHMYKSTIDTWYKLPDCPARDVFVFAIVMIHGELTAISGDNKALTAATMKRYEYQC